MRIHNLILASGICIISCFQIQAQTEINLYNGKNLDGWEQKGGAMKYFATDSAIVGETVLGEKSAFLCYKKNFLNFVFEFETRLDDNMNSGVQFRSLSKPDYKDGEVYGYQVELDPSPRMWSGALYDQSRRKWLQTLEGKPEELRKAFNIFGWNKIRVEALNQNIKIFVNGKQTVEYTDTLKAEPGFIALQVHNVWRPSEIEFQQKNRPMRVMWRNLKITEK